VAISQTQAGTITVTATATDNVGVAGVQFLMNGQPYGAEITAAPYSVSVNTTTLPAGVHSFAARARDAAGNAATSTPVTFTIAPPATATAIRINAGGPAYTAPSGAVWSADTGFEGGYIDSVSVPTANTDTPALYQDQRVGRTLRYRLAVPNGSYRVRLKFAEIYFKAAGQRVMDISLNGQLVEPRFDIFAAAGGRHIAVDREYVVNVTNGEILLNLQGIQDNAGINALEASPL
jgi:hypothetical protein